MRPAPDPHSSAAAGTRAVTIVLCVFTLITVVGWAGAVFCSPIVQRVRTWTAPDHTRIVLDLSERTPYELRTVHDPERLAVNVPSASLRDISSLEVADGLIRSIRCNQSDVRAQVVLDLEYAARFRHFPLRAADGRPDRIVIDVYRPERHTSPGVRSDGQCGKGHGSAAPLTAAITGKLWTVVFDPGHGGLDPGATRGGICEKDVVLQVARKAIRILNDVPGYRGIMTRDRDYFLPLAQRVRIAQRQEGDLFVSIHANANHRLSMSGMEVYVLSLQGATDREAQELANKENAADLVGLAPGEGQSEEVLSILMDLRMTRVYQSSHHLAHCILQAADRSGVVPTRDVKQARFQVLQTLAMPAVLVELGYLSHRHDRQFMSSDRGQETLARALVAGILQYRDDRDALVTVTGRDWTGRYQVRRGDTLWELARRHGTTIQEIRDQNHLDSASLVVGQTLKLPKVD
jgi:N-acetylmuramoyl-L-alanine amidase